ncbi:MAG TPA: hypothetical protein P5060_02180 [Candidatus Absconditabacterales bacterium]|nr:hypothetical protein [Candidatus Absconditabacterales bacterium]
MKKFIGAFLILMVFYHVIVTVLGYGIFGGDSQIYISLARDVLWLIFVIISAIVYRKKVLEYLKKWKKVWLWLVFLIVFSLGISFLNGQSLTNMMIGIKYGFFYLIVFLTASFVGYCGIKKINMKEISWFQYLLIGIVVIGFLWQILKIIRPEMFMNIGYGKFDDFYFGANPPIYYLTGFEGTTRWQGIFAGPNNYGYFLIAFLPLVLLWWNTGIKKLKNIFKNPISNINFLYLGLWILAILMTLSRSAILGMALIFVLLAKDWIKKNKKAAMIIGIILVLGIAGLSVLKGSSTVGHIQAKFAYIGEIVNNPLGHGLGTSGPAVHHEGTMLPENYFMQVMLDIGTLGFIFWAVVIFQILLVFKNIENKFKSEKIDQDQELVFLQWRRLYMGRSILLVIGLFLHVFEDSMLNYIFFVVFGLTSGYLSQLYDVKKSLNIKSLFSKK